MSSGSEARDTTEASDNMMTPRPRRLYCYNCQDYTMHTVTALQTWMCSECTSSAICAECNDALVGVPPRCLTAMSSGDAACVRARAGR